VDVQNDFMTPSEQGGRLYVRHLTDPADAGATRIIPTLEQTVRWLHANTRAVVYTGDWHTDDDREIDRQHPNFRDTYPAHCMGAGSIVAERPGAELIDAIAPQDAVVVVDREATGDAAERAATHAASGGTVMIRKREFSVFEGQRQTDRFLDALAHALDARPEIIVCGVATDVCVRMAVEGFLDRGYDVTVVRDAVWGLGIHADESLFAAWSARGARIATLLELHRSVNHEGRGSHGQNSTRDRDPQRPINAGGAR
jgi:nicotinamidase-related amidase